MIIRAPRVIIKGMYVETKKSAPNNTFEQFNRVYNEWKCALQRYILLLLVISYLKIITKIVKLGGSEFCAHTSAFYQRYFALTITELGLSVLGNYRYC